MNIVRYFLILFQFSIVYSFWSRKYGFTGRVEQEIEPKTIPSENSLSKLPNKEKYSFSNDAINTNDKEKHISKILVSSKGGVEFPSDPEITMFGEDRNSLIIESEEIIRTIRRLIPNYKSIVGEDISKMLYYMATANKMTGTVKVILNELQESNILKHIEAIEKYVEVLYTREGQDPYYIDQAKTYVKMLYEGYNLLKSVDSGINTKGLIILSEAFSKFFYNRKYFEELKYHNIFNKKQKEKFYFGAD